MNTITKTELSSKENNLTGRIRVAIMGYGNLGKAVEEIVLSRKEFDLVVIFSRRKVKSEFGTNVRDVKDSKLYVGKIDVVFLTMGSFCDIENFAYGLAKNFNFVDSFDTHSKLTKYISNLDLIAKTSNTVTLSAFGWDPGLLSWVRVMLDSLSFNDSLSNTFWGKGISQGHSNAIREICGVENALQYTIPDEQIVKKCRRLFDYNPTDFEKHKRFCLVAETPGEDRQKITKKIKAMKNYFENYHTEVNFVPNEEIIKRQKRLSHKGYVVSNFKVLGKYKARVEFSLKISSNPHFTAQIMCVGALAVYRLAKAEDFGAKCIFDVPPSCFLGLSREDLLKKL